MHQPVHILDNSPFNSPLPLTKENLMNLEDTMEQQQVTNEILQRYCHEILLNARQQQQQQMTRPSYRERCQSTPPQIQQRDVVVASPRVLPFPYHNDSLFLPTAEQIQYHHLHSSAVSSSTSRADSASIPPNSSEFLISRPQSATTANIHNSSSNQSFTTSIHQQQPAERKSLPARLDYSKIIISKSTKQQQRFLRRSSSFGSTSSTLSTPPGEDIKNNFIKKHWLKRILKFFNKKNKYHHQKQQEGMNQVWYCQYSKNPSTRFEKYYHHHHQQQQQQMISVS